MYVNPFWMGVVATICAEVIVSFALCIWISAKGGKKK